MLGSDVTAILKAAVDAGFSLIPVNADKKPRLATWKPYQNRLPTREELTRWWNDDPPAWGVVTGKVSGIVILDFDGPAGLETLRKLNLTPHVRTGSGAYSERCRSAFRGDGDRDSELMPIAIPR